MDSLTRICTSPAAHTPSIAFFFIRFPQRVDWTSGDAQPASRGSVDWTSGRAWQRLCSVPPSVTLSCQGTCPSRAAPAADIPTGVAAGRRRRSMFTAVSCCGTSRACSGWALDGRPWMAVPLLGCGTSGQLLLWCWAARRARGDVLEGTCSRGRGRLGRRGSRLTHRQCTGDVLYSGGADCKVFKWSIGHAPLIQSRDRLRVACNAAPHPREKAPSADTRTRQVCLCRNCQCPD